MTAQKKDDCNTLIHVSAVLYDNPVGKHLEKSLDGSGLEKTSLLSERNTVGEAKLFKFNSAEEAFQFRLSADARTMFLAGTFDPDADLEAIGPKWLIETARGQFEPSRGALHQLLDAAPANARWVCQWPGFRSARHRLCW